MENKNLITNDATSTLMKKRSTSLPELNVSHEKLSKKSLNTSLETSTSLVKINKLNLSKETVSNDSSSPPSVASEIMAAIGNSWEYSSSENSINKISASIDSGIVETFHSTPIKEGNVLLKEDIRISDIPKYRNTDGLNESFEIPSAKSNASIVKDINPKPISYLNNTKSDFHSDDKSGNVRNDCQQNDCESVNTTLINISTNYEFEFPEYNSQNGIVKSMNGPVLDHSEHDSNTCINAPSINPHEVNIIKIDDSHIAPLKRNALQSEISDIKNSETVNSNDHFHFGAVRKNLNKDDPFQGETSHMADAGVECLNEDFEKSDPIYKSNVFKDKFNSQNDSKNVSESDSPVNIRNIIVPVSNCNGKSSTKKQFCPYCKKLIAKLPRHLESKHPKEEKVLKLKKLSKGTSSRKVLLDSIRKEGNYLHNTNKKYNTGILITVRRRQENHNKNAEDYIHCD